MSLTSEGSWSMYSALRHKYSSENDPTEAFSTKGRVQEN